MSQNQIHILEEVTNR